MRNAGFKIALLLLAAVALAGCNESGSGSALTSNSGTSSTTLFTGGTSEGSVLTVGAAQGTPLFVAQGEGGPVIDTPAPVPSVPEPTELGALAIGGAMLAGLVIRRKRSVKA